jgi:hypothetical protein
MRRTKMKRFTGFTGMLVLALTFVLFVSGCASSGGTINDNLVAGEGETLVTVQRESAFAGSAVKIEVYIDGNMVFKLSNGAAGKVVVPNGRHTIYVISKNPFSPDAPSDSLSFTADSIERYFRTKATGSRSTFLQEDR